MTREDCNGSDEAVARKRHAEMGNLLTTIISYQNDYSHHIKFQVQIKSIIFKGNGDEKNTCMLVCINKYTDELSVHCFGGIKRLIRFTCTAVKK